MAELDDIDVPLAPTTLRRLATVRLGSGMVDVTRWAPSPDKPPVRSNAVRQALLASCSGLITAQAATAIADAVVEEDGTVQRLIAGPSIAATPEGDLAQVEVRLYTPMLMPGPQPRGRAFVLGGVEPNVTVEEPGTVVIAFRDAAHAQAWCTSTIKRTIPSASRRVEQIVAQGVLRPLQVHAAVLRLTDEGIEVPVLAIRDGISRWVASQVLLHDLDKRDPTSVARQITEVVFTGIESSKGRGWVGRSRQRINEARTRYITSVAAGDGQPGWDAVRVRQALTVPAVVTLGLLTHTPTERLRTETAIRSLVTSVHADVNGWDVDDEEIDTIDRALQAMAVDDQIRPEITDLALGVRPASEAPGIFGMPAMGDPGLQRAVLLVHHLHEADTNAALRSRLRAMTGLSSIRRSRWGRMVATVLDEPWRVSKTPCLETARRMWSHGGVLVPALAQPWTPASADSYAELVAPALAGDDDARTTLIVAGGIALLADRILTTVTVAGTGSAGETRLPWHGSPATVMHRLGHDAGPDGLRLLALVADSFDSSRTALNTLGLLRAAEDPATSAATYYVVPDLDPDQPDAVARRSDSTIRPLTELRVMTMTALDAPEQPEAAARAAVAPPAAGRTVESMRVDLVTTAAALSTHWHDLARAAAVEDRPPITAAQQQAVARAVAVVHSGITLADTEPDHLGGVLA